MSCEVCARFAVLRALQGYGRGGFTTLFPDDCVLPHLVVKWTWATTGARPDRRKDPHGTDFRPCQARVLRGRLVVEVDQ